MPWETPGGHTQRRPCPVGRNPVRLLRSARCVYQPSHCATWLPSLVALILCRMPWGLDRVVMQVQQWTTTGSRRGPVLPSSNCMSSGSEVQVTDCFMQLLPEASVGWLDMPCSILAAAISILPVVQFLQHLGSPGQARTVLCLRIIHQYCRGRAGEKPEPVRTHLRNMLIMPEMIGSVVGVYNGKTFNQVPSAVASIHAVRLKLRSCEG